MTCPAPARVAILLPAFALGVGLVLHAGRTTAQPPTPDQQAAMLLAAGQKAYNDANFTFAAEKFREFVQKFGSHKDANAARLGLGLALLDLQPPDHTKAVEALTPPSAATAFPDRPLALYYLGVAQRGLGQKEVTEGVAKPNELTQRTQAANAKFTEAAKSFTTAREAFEKKAPPDGEWAARARCDLAEVELRLGKNKEARATAEPFTKDASLAKNKSRPLGVYYHGVACFLLNDIPAAGRSLNQLAPFDQPFGPHARYLMGRVHTAEGERAEAAAAFDAVLTGYEKQKKDATDALKQPERFKADPGEKARLESLAKGPAPDYVAGSTFYGACLSYEAGQFGAALPKFQAFPKDYAASPLKDDALLRAGFCLVQTKQYDEAMKVLQPLAGVARLADQAIYWTGKAQVGKAIAAEPAARKPILDAAVTSFRTAADKAKALAATEPDARTRRADILLDLADALLTNNQAKEAAAAYEAITAEKLLPARTEELLQRIVTAYHLAGDYAVSDTRIAAFQRQFPQSPLLPLVLFRGAENASARAAQLAKQNAAPAAVQKNYADAVQKYTDLIARFPDFDRIHRARYGLGLSLVALEEWEKAAAALEAIPAAERHGDLAAVPLALADCLVRTAPAKADDALQDNILREKLGTAAGLLDGFVSANPKSPDTADALVKLGYCHKRLGIQLAPGNERNDAVTKARAAFERVGKEFPQSPAAGTAALERAKVLALQGDKGGAVNQLNAFKSDPLGKSPVAPLAYVALATLLREQNQAAQAAQVMAEARQKFEGTLTADPQRKEWVPLLRYHHGVALAEAGKPAEAKPAFDQAGQAGYGQPIAAEAALRLYQCHIDEAKKKIEAAERPQPGLTPEQLAQLGTQAKAAKAELLTAARSMVYRANQLSQPKVAQTEARARMYYDAAWAFRAAGDDPAPAYTKLIAECPGLFLAVEARLELAELTADHKKPDDAAKLLKDALDAEPTDKPTPPETADRIRLRLGAVLFDKKDFAAAQAQFEAVAGNEKSPHRAAGLYRAAECLAAQGKWEEAKNQLILFRDDKTLQNVAGVSDRAILRLGHALTELKQYDAARQAFELVASRFGDGGPWAVDARYGAGWALQNAGRYDDAVNQYAQVTQKTTDDRAGRAQLQIGLCRAAQKRWDDAGKAFAAVYYGFDAPDLRFAAMVEHARVLIESKKPADAAKLLERVVADAPPDGTWAKAARELLGKIKK